MQVPHIATVRHWSVCVPPPGKKLSYCILQPLFQYIRLSLQCTVRQQLDIMLCTGIPGSQGPCCTKANLNCARIHTDLLVIANTPRRYCDIPRPSCLQYLYSFKRPHPYVKVDEPVIPDQWECGGYAVCCSVSCLNEAVSIMGFIAATFIVLFFTNYFSWDMLLLAIFCQRNTTARVGKLGKCPISL